MNLFDIVKFNSLVDKEEKAKMLAQYAFEFAINKKEFQHYEFVEDIPSIYSKTITELVKYYYEENNWNDDLLENYISFFYTNQRHREVMTGEFDESDEDYISICDDIKEEERLKKIFEKLNFLYYYRIPIFFNGGSFFNKYSLITERIILYFKRNLIEFKKESTTKQKIKISVPQKIKILDELNILGFLQGKGFTKTNSEKLLAELFDVTDKTIRTNFNNRTHEDFAKNKIEEYKNKPSKRD